MSYNSQWDSLSPASLDIPYSRIQGELQDEPRFIRGQNTYITTGGTVSRRFGTQQFDGQGTLSGYRVDRLWSYETLDSPPYLYLIASVFNFSSSLWELRWKPLSGSATAWSATGNTFRSLHLSTAPHEGIVQRGLFYVKGFPTSASGEKLGTAVMDGTGGAGITFKPWGILGPTQAVILTNASAGIIANSGGIIIAATSINVTETSGAVFPAAPFVIQIDYEQMNVTSITGASPNRVFTVTRAFNGTVAATHAQGEFVIYRNWSASGHEIVVNQGWTYAYAWKDINGQYSNLSPPQTNPDLLSGNTLPFFNQIPQILVQGLADTTNFPSIGVFRTTDGGGTYYFLQDVTNSGAGNIGFVDTHLASSLGSVDPIPDTQLDTGTVGPSLTSNSPPPAVLAPLVTGVATPAQSTPIASYQGRLWYGIGNVLFFSGEEEVNIGIPEESWPSGLNGNFFRFQYPITNVAATSNNLYVFTIKATYIVTGTNLQTFSVQPILANIGFPPNQARAVTVFSTSVVFLSHDYRLILLSDGSASPVIMSDPLASDIADQIAAGTANSLQTYFDIKYYSNQDKELIIVNGIDQSINTYGCKQWVYDIKKSLKLSMLGGYYSPLKHMWNLPWNIPATAMVVTRTNTYTQQSSIQYLLFDVLRPTSSNASDLSLLDTTFATTTDWVGAGTMVNFDIDMVYCLSQVPAGDHVNQRRVPMITPVLYAISFERSVFCGDQDPDFAYFLDDVWSNPISDAISEDPPRRPNSLGYKTMQFPIFKVAQRVAWELSKTNSEDKFELQTFTITYEPDAGA